jgi:uncharacterized protein YegP (UPF0339 family)
MDKLTFSIYKTIDSEFYFRLRDAADRIILTSRHYKSMTSCINDIYWLQTYKDFEVLEKCEGNDVRHLYYIIRPEGSVLAKSPVYALQRVMNEDLMIMKEDIAKAAVIDLTSVVRFFRSTNV